jgi:acetyl-CoA carboxylase/biotin carboxylase 1
MPDEEKPHHRLKRLSALVDNIMLGYEPSLPVADLFTDFVVALHHEELPLYEFAEILGSISSRIPQQLCEFLYTCISSCRSNGTPIDFATIESEITSTVNLLPLDDQDAYLLVMTPLFDILKRYADGVPSRARSVLLGFLESYKTLEQLYEGSTPARVILGLRETYKGNLEYVRDIARSASKPKNRAEFVLFLLDFFSKEQSAEVQKSATAVMSALAHLTSPGASKVSFRAREILIGFQSPSITQRRDAILTIFEKVVKKSADGSQFFFNFSQLSRTISSRYSLLDILPDLFFHPEMNTRAIALYTYIMRTNQAYTVTSFDHHFLGESVVLSWDFEHQEQSLFKPYRDADPLVPAINASSAVRKGIIFTCETLDQLVDQIRAVKPLLDLPFNQEDGADPNSDFAFFATVALKCSDDLVTDEVAAKTLNDYMEEHRDFLKKYLIHRTTFMILVPNAHSRYFTFKSSKGHAEDVTIRHIEPFMAHRLEMERLANFDIKPCLVGNRGVRIYHAVGKSNTTDVRFFVRGIIYPTNVATPHDFFIAEGNRITSGMLDTMELLTVSHPNTDCNHILLHFIPVFNLTAEQVHFHLDQLLRRHRSRLSKLRITEVEICFTGYHPETRDIVPFRFIASIQSQYVIDIAWYHQKKTLNGSEILVSSSSPAGPLHGQPVYRLHDPKQYIQPKRYRAHLLGTAYVYDFPALFQEALKQEWIKLKGIVAPGLLMDCKELALDNNMELQETQRAPGIFLT